MSFDTSKDRTDLVQLLTGFSGRRNSRPGQHPILSRRRAVSLAGQNKAQETREEVKAQRGPVTSNDFPL